MTGQAIDVIGRWELISWYQDYDDGRVIYPFGEQATGFIDYQKTGQMACAFARANRPTFVTGGQWTAQDSDKVSAYDGYLSYCGTFEFDGSTVRHHVQFSLYPDWVGTTMARQVSYQDGVLKLLARLEVDTPEARTATLVWRRPE